MINKLFYPLTAWLFVVTLSAIEISHDTKDLKKTLKKAYFKSIKKGKMHRLRLLLWDVPQSQRVGHGYLRKHCTKANLSCPTDLCDLVVGYLCVFDKLNELVDTQKRTGLHIACKYYQLKEATQVAMIRLLLQRGLDVNAKDNDSSTPLHILCDDCGNNKATIGLLLKYKADVNAKDKDLWTPLHYLCSYYGNRATMTLLLRHKADVNARDKHLRTPLHYLCSYYGNNRATMALLLKRKADVNAKDKELWTPLHFFCFGNAASVSSLCALLKAGGNLALENNKGQTPYEVAIESGCNSLCAYMKDNNLGRGRKVGPAGANEQKVTVSLKI